MLSFLASYTTSSLIGVSQKFVEYKSVSWPKEIWKHWTRDWQASRFFSVLSTGLLLPPHCSWPIFLDPCAHYDLGEFLIVINFLLLFCHHHHHHHQQQLRNAVRLFTQCRMMKFCTLSNHFLYFFYWPLSNLRSTSLGVLSKCVASGGGGIYKETSIKFSPYGTFFSMLYEFVRRGSS